MLRFFVVKTSLEHLGYIDARHKDHYEITTDALRLLIERVNKLQAIAEKLCQGKIASFDTQ
jgi:hypothetical protein